VIGGAWGAGASSPATPVRAGGSAGTGPEGGCGEAGGAGELGAAGGSAGASAGRWAQAPARRRTPRAAIGRLIAVTGEVALRGRTPRDTWNVTRGTWVVSRETKRAGHRSRIEAA